MLQYIRKATVGHDDRGSAVGFWLGVIAAVTVILFVFYIITHGFGGAIRELSSVSSQYQP